MKRGIGDKGENKERAYPKNTLTGRYYFPPEVLCCILSACPGQDNSHMESALTIFMKENNMLENKSDVFLNIRIAWGT